MALTAAEEAQTRELLAQQAAILALAAEEPAIISSLGATDVSLSDLAAASSLGDSDLLLVRQGVTDKSIAGSIVKSASSQPDASETVKGIVELATVAEAQAGTDNVRAVTPAGLASTSQKQIQSITASVATNALTVTYGGGNLVFRNSTLSNGTPNDSISVSSNSITIPSGATLGTTNGIAARLVFLEAYNGGSPVLCVSNIAGGVQLDETNLISPTTISSGATSASTIYSASSVSASSPYRVVGFCDVTEATAGTWATAPSTVQGTGGQALAALSSLGYGQSWQNVTASRAAGTTYYNTTGKPIQLLITVTSGNAAALLINGSTAFPAISGQLTIQGVIIPHGASYALGNSSAPSTWWELR